MITSNARKNFGRIRKLSSNFHIIKRATVVWEPINTVSVFLEGELYPTLSLVFMFFVGLLRALCDTKLHLGDITGCTSAGTEYPDELKCDQNAAREGVMAEGEMLEEDEKGCTFCMEADVYMSTPEKQCILTLRADTFKAVNDRYNTMTLSKVVSGAEPIARKIWLLCEDWLSRHCWSLLCRLNSWGKRRLGQSSN